MDTPAELLDAPTGDVASAAPPEVEPTELAAPASGTAVHGTAVPPLPPPIGQERVVSARSLLEKQKAAGALKPKSNAPKFIALAVALLAIAGLYVGVTGFFTPETTKITIGNPAGAEPGSVDLAKLMMAPYGFVEKRVLLEAHFSDIGSTQQGYTTIEAFAPATGSLDFIVRDKYVPEFQKLEKGERFGAYGRMEGKSTKLVFRVD